MIIDCEKEIVGLDGKQMVDVDSMSLTLGKILGNVLVSSKTGGKMKLFILGTKLFQDAKVEVDESDLTLIKRAVQESEIYNALVLGQCELLLQEMKPSTSK